MVLPPTAKLIAPTASDGSTTVKPDIINDTWVISTYIDKRKNETARYNRYSSTIADNGTLTASASLFTGTWSIGSADSGYDDNENHSNDDGKLIIKITGNSQLDVLTDDFQIVSISTSEIFLKDDNLMKTKELRFVKKSLGCLSPGQACCKVTWIVENSYSLFLLYISLQLSVTKFYLFKPSDCTDSLDLIKTT